MFCYIAGVLGDVLSVKAIAVIKRDDQAIKNRNDIETEFEKAKQQRVFVLLLSAVGRRASVVGRKVERTQRKNEVYFALCLISESLVFSVGGFTPNLPFCLGDMFTNSALMLVLSFRSCLGPHHLNLAACCPPLNL